jgi:hypothetical protein
VEQPTSTDTAVDTDALNEAASFLRHAFSGTAKQRSRRLRNAPIHEIRHAALHHPDPFMRRGCLYFLDHYANDQSTAVFGRALHDPVDFVRNAAMHSLACERCMTGELCVDDVVPALVDVLATDRSVEMRAKAIPMLLQLSERDARARSALECAAAEDPDALIRKAASDALAGRFVAPRKRYEREQRRHARTASR